ncbi:MAG: T9SS type A sorting domain-containing protein [Bacteroidetes bacterium]|nr:T9SS type A sorting domain-containing protein [Bacteroidota bacterium]
MANAIQTSTQTTKPINGFPKADGVPLDFSSTTGNASPNLRFLVTRNGIDVRLSNPTTITALRFEIEFESRFRYKPPELHARVQNLNSYINFQDNVLSFVLLGMHGEGIATGNGTIASIPLDQDLNFNVVSAYASTGTGYITEIKYQVSNDDSEDRALSLEQNDPNPFATKTIIDFAISDETDTKLLIYDVGGALVRTLLDHVLTAGEHSVEWDGKDDSGKSVDAGIYFYRLYAGVYSITRKMVFMK